MLLCTLYKFRKRLKIPATKTFFFFIKLKRGRSYATFFFFFSTIMAMKPQFIVTLKYSCSTEKQLEGGKHNRAAIFL